MGVVVRGLIVLVSGVFVSSPLLARGCGGRAGHVGGTVAALFSSIDITDQEHVVFKHEEAHRAGKG